MTYGIIFWGNSSDSERVFKLQKKIVRLMIDVQSCNPCTDLFKRVEIITLPCGYIFSLINFITNNEEHFQTNTDVQSVNTKTINSTISINQLLISHAFRKGIKVFNNLPSDLKSLMNEKA
jgi:hypothetical protein